MKTSSAPESARGVNPSAERDKNEHQWDKKSHRTALIAVVDDEAEMRGLLGDFLRGQGQLVREFESASQLLAVLASPDAPNLDLVISDINMPGVSGLELATQLQEKLPGVPVILITAFGSIQTAIDAMKRGAYHYIVKPFKLDEVLLAVQRALEHRFLSADNSVLREQVMRGFSLGKVVGKGKAMRQVFDLVERVAQAHANVLVLGESGTGKEMIARLIHELGPRKARPFVAINCTAIPDNLLESELFGHAKGSFTGALNRKRGLFEEAEGGTLFLDEIGDMDLLLQSKLLRVLQDRKIRPVGENVEKAIDVRIIAATHQDLKKAVKEGRFREDLFYRLSVVPVSLPPLRERLDDIPILAETFLRKYAALNHSRVSGFSAGALKKLLGLRWPGNVRELENVVERAVVLARGERIVEADLPEGEGSDAGDFFERVSQDLPTFEQLERRYLELVLEKTGGKKEKAAQILGINRRTLYRKEREYGLIALGDVDPNLEGALEGAPEVD